jgi:hypothetical protein
VISRGAIARGVSIAWLAVVSGIASRGVLLSIVGRKVDAGMETFAEIAAKLPAPRAATSIDEAPLPPPPALVASAIAETSPSAAPKETTTTPITNAKKITTTDKASKKGSAPLVVTRAEVEDAIATKCHGVRATLVRDDGGAPIGLALHRVGPLARFGVAEGDVLVAANGQSLRTPDEALAALGAMKDATRVSVALRRGDAIYVITVQVADDPGQ